MGNNLRRAAHRRLGLALVCLGVWRCAAEPAPRTGARDAALSYLLSRLSPFQSEGIYYELGEDRIRLSASPEGARFIPSFELPDDAPLYPVLTEYKRVFVYDAAVEVCALVLAGKHSEAMQLLRTIEAMQLLDGGLGFSFNASGDTFYNHSYLRSGTVAWAGYAAVLYGHETGETDFRAFAGRIAEWLERQQVPGDRLLDPRAGLIMGGHGQWAEDYSELTKGKRTWAATEHAIDAYFFLRDYARSQQAPSMRSRYAAAADRVKRALLEQMWTEPAPGLGRFVQGVDRQSLNLGKALDCCGGWGALFLLAVGEREKAAATLAYTEETFATTFRPAEADEGVSVTGYRPYAGHNEGIDWDRYPDVVWSEGSLGVALSYLRLGRRDKFESIVDNMLKLCTVPGDPRSGVRYSRYRQDLAAGPKAPVDTATVIKDLTQAPSACCTAWLLLVLESAEEGNFGKFWGPDQ